MARKKHVDVVAVEADADARKVDPPERTNERTWQAALRPRTFDEYIGQKDLVENLRVSVHAAKQGGWALDHFLFAGPPGLGKTTLAHVIANELGVNLHVSSGPAIDHKGKLASLLTGLGERDALFIDEIHRLQSGRRRKSALSRDGRFSLRSVHRRGAARQGRHHAAAQVHAARRDHADGPFVGAATRPVRLSLAAPLLQPRRHEVDRAAIRAVDRRADRRRRRARDRPPRARHAADREPPLASRA